MKLPFRFLKAVEQDLRVAIEWYEGQCAGLGTEFSSEFFSNLDRIALFPELGVTLRQNVRLRVTRRFPYVVYYRIHPDHIEIVAVLHGRQRSALWRQRVR